ncbi:cation transporter [Candidatus Gottesmanbacteria bacterium]|nr:cation transporter [Candidatus Gottesmanbacteria bacterium]
MKKKIITIAGTHCTSCKALIEEVAKENLCVAHASVDFKTGKTIIDHKDCLDWPAFVKEIESLAEYKVIAA